MTTSSEGPLSATDRPQGMLGWVLALGVLSVLVRLHELAYPIGWDEGYWAYGGREWLIHGRPLYDAIFDGKPPVIWLLYGLVFRTGWGIVGVRCVGMALVWMAACLMMLIGNRLQSRSAGILAAIAYVLCISQKTVGIKGTVTTELLVSVFVVAAVAAILCGRTRPWLVIAGVLGGLALQSRQTAVLDLAALTILAWMAAGGWRSVLWFLSGAVALNAVVAGWFAATGQLANLVQIGFLGQESAVGYSDGLHRLQFLPTWTEFAVTSLPLLLGGAIAALRALPPQSALVRRSLWIWLVLSIASPWSSGPRYTHHMGAVVAPVCLLGALGLAWVWEWAGRRSHLSRLAILAALAVTLVPVARNELPTAKKTVHFLQGKAWPKESLEVARIIDADSTPSDTIYCVGYADNMTTGVYLYSDRVAPTRFAMDDHLSHPWALREVSEGFAKSPPRWLVFDQEYDKRIAEGSAELPTALGYVYRCSQSGDYERLNLPQFKSFILFRRTVSRPGISSLAAGTEGR